MNNPEVPEDVMIARIGPIQDTEGQELYVHAPLTAALSPESVAFAADTAEGLAQVAATLPESRFAVPPEMEAAAPSIGASVRQMTQAETELAADVALGMRPLDGLPATRVPALRREFLRGWGALLGSWTYGVVQKGAFLECELWWDALGTQVVATASLGYAGGTPKALSIGLQGLQPEAGHILRVEMQTEPDYVIRALRAAYGLEVVPVVLRDQRPIDGDWANRWFPAIAAIGYSATALQADLKSAEIDIQLLDSLVVHSNVVLTEDYM